MFGAEMSQKVSARFCKKKSYRTTIMQVICMQVETLTCDMIAEGRLKGYIDQVWCPTFICAELEALKPLSAVVSCWIQSNSNKILIAGVQVGNMVHFEDDQGQLAQWDEQIMGVCDNVNKVVDHIFSLQQAAA